MREDTHASPGDDAQARDTAERARGILFVGEPTARASPRRADAERCGGAATGARFLHRAEQVRQEPGCKPRSREATRSHQAANRTGTQGKGTCHVARGVKASEDLWHTSA